MNLRLDDDDDGGAYVRRSAFLALVICVVACAGWVLGVRWMTSFGFPWATMKINTALGLGTIAAGLWGISDVAARAKWAPRLALVAAAIGATTLLEYAGILNGFDEALIPDPWSEAAPGRPSPMTALEILALSGAVAAHQLRGWRWVYHACCWGVLASGWFSLVAFLYSPRGLARVPWFETLSLPTAFALMLLGLAVLQLRPDEGVLRLLRGQGAHGLATRRFVSLGTFAPVMLGWVLVHSPNRSRLGIEMELAVVSTLAVLCFVGMSFHIARRLESLERERSDDELRLRETLEATEAALHRATAYLEAAPGAMLVVDDDGRIELANLQAESVFGFEPGELRGRQVHELVPERFRSHHPELVGRFFAEGRSRGLGGGSGLVARRKDGHEVPVDISVSPFVSGGKRLVVCGIRDLSAQMEAETARSRAVSRLQLATSAAHIGIWEWDIPSDKLIWNDEMLTIYGQTRETFTGEVTAWQEALLPEERAEVDGMLQAVIDDSREPTFEFNIRRPDGELRRLEMFCAVERDASGQPTRMIGTNRDVTELHSATLKVQTERRRFEGIFHSMFQMTWILSPQGEIIVANRTASEMNGVVAENLDGTPFWRSPWCPDARAAEELERAVRRAASGKFSRQWTRIGPDPKRTVPVDLSIKPVFSQTGEVEMLITEARDVSDAEAARTALVESEARFRNALDHSAIGLTLVDLRGRFTRVNSALCQILGRTAEELLSLTFQDITHPDDLDVDVSLVQETLAGKRSHYHLEKRYLTKDGGSVWCLLTVSLVKNTSGEPQYFIAQIQDFSERNRALEQVKQSLREKEVLLREIHHRVKNNLQVVSSILRLARKQVEQPQLRSVFDETSARIQTMAMVHERLCGTEDLGAVDFASQLRDLCTLAQRASRVQSDRVQVVLDTQPTGLEMDQAIPLGLIANELLSNAFKHAFNSRARGELRVTLKRSEDELLLSVKDDGAGLPEDFDIATTNSLGMRIITRLTNQLRGTLTVNRGPGAEFVVRLSFADSASEVQLGAA